MSNLVRRIEKRIMKDRKVEKTRLLQPSTTDKYGNVEPAVYGYPLLVPKVEAANA